MPRILPLSPGIGKDEIAPRNCPFDATHLAQLSSVQSCDETVEFIIGVLEHIPEVFCLSCLRSVTPSKTCTKSSSCQKSASQLLTQLVLKRLGQLGANFPRLLRNHKQWFGCRALAAWAYLAP
jgi:hypothetical protein